MLMSAVSELAIDVGTSQRGLSGSVDAAGVLLLATP